MALRGGYSLSFDVPNFGTLADPNNFAHASTGVFTQLNLGFFNQNNTALNDQDLTASDYTPGSGCYDPSTGVGSYICFDSVWPDLYSEPVQPGRLLLMLSPGVQNFKTPRAHNFNVSLQSELFHNNVLTLTYSGQRGRDLVIYSDLNASPLGSPCTSPSDCDAFRPLAASFPDLRHVIQATNGATFQYDSLQERTL